MRIHQAEERKEIDIPISEIIQEGGKLNILPSVKNFFSIDYKPGSQKLSLVAGGFIGLIPINSSLAIEIKPKFSILNLTRIVSIAEGNFNTLSFFSRQYKQNNEFNPVVFEFMAECLANELESLETEGILKNYIFKKEETNKIRGKVNVNNSIKSLWSHGHFNKASVDYYGFTTDNQFNRLIKFTLKFCIEELGYIDSSKTVLRDLLIEYYLKFDSVSLEYNLDNFEEVFDAIKSEKISVLRNYYINICQICQLIINKKGVSFNDNGEDQLLSSFTLDMASIFEQYLLNSIKHHRDLLPSGTLVLDGNKEGKKYLYNQPSNAKGEAKPDIILKIDGNCKLIADAKYKIKTKELDRYQVISHAISYNAKVAVLILPKDENHNGDSLVSLGTIGEDYKIDVYEYYFNLSGTDLSVEENALVSALNQLIHTTNPVNIFTEA